eukprot:6516440-Pyramimonas_sp.AAC.2
MRQWETDYTRGRGAFLTVVVDEREGRGPQHAHARPLQAVEGALLQPHPAASHLAHGTPITSGERAYSGSGTQSRTGRGYGVARLRGGGRR